MLIEGSALSVSPSGTPRILWDSAVTFSGITASVSATGYPASNLANPATNQEWRAGEPDSPAVAVEITMTMTAGTRSAVGIAGHNFGTTGTSVEVGYYSTSPSVWNSLAGPQTPDDDEPILFHFTAQSLSSIVIKLGVGTEPSRAASVYAGNMLVMERGVDVGEDFAVPRFARKTEYAAPRSERGDYLGRIVTSQWIDDITHNYKHLTPDFFRDYIDPFIQGAQEDAPFFYAMKAEDGVNWDVAYLWLTDDPVPLKSPVTERYAVALKMGGVVG